MRSQPRSACLGGRPRGPYAEPWSRLSDAQFPSIARDGGPSRLPRSCGWSGATSLRWPHAPVAARSSGRRSHVRGLSTGQDRSWCLPYSPFNTAEPSTVALLLRFVVINSVIERRALTFGITSSCLRSVPDQRETDVDSDEDQEPGPEYHSTRSKFWRRPAVETPTLRGLATVCGPRQSPRLRRHGRCRRAGRGRLATPRCGHCAVGRACAASLRARFAVLASGCA
jgi:hypothetical protein